MKFEIFNFVVFKIQSTLDYIHTFSIVNHFYVEIIIQKWINSRVYCRFEISYLCHLILSPISAIVLDKIRPPIDKKWHHRPKKTTDGRKGSPMSHRSPLIKPFSWTLSENDMLFYSISGYRLPSLVTIG